MRPPLKCFEYWPGLARRPHAMIHHDGHPRFIPKNTNISGAPNHVRLFLRDRTLTGQTKFGIWGMIMAALGRLHHSRCRICSNQAAIRRFIEKKMMLFGYFKLNLRSAFPAAQSMDAAKGQRRAGHANETYRQPGRAKLPMRIGQTAE